MERSLPVALPDLIYRSALTGVGFPPLGAVRSRKSVVRCFGATDVMGIVSGSSPQDGVKKQQSLIRRRFSPAFNRLHFDRWN